MRSRLYAYHPVALVCYFVPLLLFCLFFPHPVASPLLAAGAVLCRAALPGFSRKQLAFPTVLALVVAITNPLFVRSGQTPLLYLNDAPYTLEALVYGAVSGASLFGGIVWFSVFSQVMTSDKLFYLFSGALEKVSLAGTLALRFVPLYTQKAREASLAQSMLHGRAETSAAKAQSALRVTSIVTTWALENAIVTADTMRARG